MKPFLNQEAAEEISGYQVTTCAEKDCKANVWVAPWYVPLKIYCEEHRAIRADDAREEAFQDKINEAKEDE